MSDARDALRKAIEWARTVMNDTWQPAVVRGHLLTLVYAAARAQAEGGTVPRGPMVYPVRDFVREEMDARDWSLKTLVEHMPGEQQTNRLAMEILLYAADEPGLFLGNDMAAELSTAFGVSAQMLLNLDASYRAWRDAAPRADEGKERDRKAMDEAGYIGAAQPAAAPDAELVAEIDIELAHWGDIAPGAIGLLRRCRTRLAQPAITDAEVASCLEPLPERDSFYAMRAEQMQGVIRRLAQPAITDDQRIFGLVGELEQCWAQIARKDKALREFLAKYDLCEPALTDAFSFQQIHGGLYRGPNWSAELAALRATLSDTQEPT